MSGDFSRKFDELLGKWLADLDGVIAVAERGLDECLHTDFTDACANVAARYRSYSEELKY